MAEHNTLTGSDLHEPKGIDALSGGASDAKKVYVSDGASSGAWDNVPELHTTIWKDNVAAFIAASTAGAGGLTAPSVVKITDNGAGSKGIWGYSFDAISNEELLLSFHIDHDYKVGTSIYPHVHWIPDDNTAGTVRWGIEYAYALRNDTTPDDFGNSSIIYIEDTVNGNQGDHIISEYAPGLLLPNLEPDTVIICRVFRDAVSDTYTGEAIGLFADLHYQADHVGTPNKDPDFYA